MNDTTKQTAASPQPQDNGANVFSASKNMSKEVEVRMFQGQTLETIQQALQDRFGTAAVQAEFEKHWRLYVARTDGIYKGEGSGINRHFVRLTTFRVDTLQQVIYDDGITTTKSYELDITCCGDLRFTSIPLSADNFHFMRWPVAVDPNLAVLPKLEPEARFGIQTSAKKPPAKRVYTHTGWRKFEEYDAQLETTVDRWAFLHTNGAIGKDGAVVTTETVTIKNEKMELRRPKFKAEPFTSHLKQIALPEPPTGEDLKTAVRASLKFLDLRADHITMPLYAAVWRAPLPNPAITLWLLGATGRFKTALALLDMQHYGSGFDKEEKILHWSDTDNFALSALHEAKDSVLIVDDFVPESNRKGRDKQNASADKVVRGQGNRGGRNRLGRDGKPQESKPPRALLISTGEDRPTGHSLAARTIYVKFPPKEGMNYALLSACQNDAAAGLYAQALAGYLQFLAGQYDELAGYVQKRTDELRAFFKAEDRHAKSATNMASLSLGFEMFLRYAVSAQAMSQSEADELWKRFQNAMMILAKQQDEYQSTEDPIAEAIALLKAAKTSGKIFLNLVEIEPGEQIIPKPGSLEIGQLDDDGSWMCVPETLFSAISRLYREQGGSFPFNNRSTFFAALKERNLIETDAGENRFTKRARKWRSADDSLRPRVIYFPAHVFEED